MRYEAVVIIQPDLGYLFTADGQTTDVLVIDGREPESKAAAAEWCARQLDEVADLPPSSNVRVLVEQFVEDITGPSASPKRTSTPSGNSR